MAKVDYASRGFERESKDKRDAGHREGTVRDSREDSSKDPHDN